MDSEENTDQCTLKLAQAMVINAKLRKALEEIASKELYILEREKSMQECQIKNWTKESARYMYLRAWNLKAYIAEQALKKADKGGIKP